MNIRDQCAELGDLIGNSLQISSKNAVETRELTQILQRRIELLIEGCLLGLSQEEVRVRLRSILKAIRAIDSMAENCVIQIQTNGLLMRHHIEDIRREIQEHREALELEETMSRCVPITKDDSSRLPRIAQAILNHF